VGETRIVPRRPKGHTPSFRPRRESIRSVGVHVSTDATFATERDIVVEKQRVRCEGTAPWTMS
jgi:hypothetical protein